jgi:predicted MFS family arabinose efflux permease
MVAGSLTLATTGILPVFLVGALAVQMSREFGYGSRGIGASIAGFYLVSTVSSLTLGRLADRIGWHGALRAGGWGSVLALIIIGNFSRSLTSVVLLVGAAGLSNALLQPSVNLFLIRESAPDIRGLVFGLKQAAIPLAALAGGLSVPAIALTVGWRWVFFLAAAFGVLAIALLPDDTNQERPQTPTRPVRTGAHSQSLWRLVVVALLGQIGASALGSFVVVSAVVVGMREGHAGLLLAAASVAGIGSRIALGRLADRGLRLDLFPISMLMLVGSFGLALIAVQSVWAAVVGTILGFVAGWGWPGLFNLLVATWFEDAPASATGATQVGVYMGNGLGPLMFGFIAAGSISAAWIVSAAFLFLAFVFAFGSHLGTRRVPG